MTRRRLAAAAAGLGACLLVAGVLVATLGGRSGVSITTQELPSGTIDFQVTGIQSGTPDVLVESYQGRSAPPAELLAAPPGARTLFCDNTVATCTLRVVDPMTRRVLATRTVASPVAAPAPTGRPGITGHLAWALGHPSFDPRTPAAMSSTDWSPGYRPVISVRGWRPGDRLIVTHDGRRVGSRPVGPWDATNELGTTPGNWGEALVSPSGKVIATDAISVPRWRVPAGAGGLRGYVGVAGMPTHPVGLSAWVHYAIVRGRVHATLDPMATRIDGSWRSLVPHALPAGLSLRLSHDGHVVWTHPVRLDGSALYRPVVVDKPGVWQLAWFEHGRRIALSAAFIPEVSR